MQAVLAKTESRQPLVSFRVGHQLFALKVGEVKNALRQLPTTEVPKAPVGVRGVASHAGKTVSVLDLRACFAMPARAVPSQAVLLVAHEGEDVALVVDKIEDVIEATDADFSAVPVTMDPVWQRVTAGVVQHAGGLVALLDVPGVIAGIR